MWLEIQPQNNPLVVITEAPAKDVHAAQVPCVFFDTDLYPYRVMLGNNQVVKGYIRNSDSVHKTPFVGNDPVFQTLSELMMENQMGYNVTNINNNNRKIS
jgi:hypothetical protein